MVQRIQCIQRVHCVQCVLTHRDETRRISREVLVQIQPSSASGCEVSQNIQDKAFRG